MVQMIYQKILEVYSKCVTWNVVKYVCGYGHQL